MPNPDRGHHLLDFVTSGENPEGLARAGGLPPTLASVCAEANVLVEYRWYPNQLVALENAQPRLRITDWSRVQSIMGDDLQLALFDEMTAADAIAKAPQAIAAALGH